MQPGAEVVSADRIPNWSAAFGPLSHRADAPNWTTISSQIYGYDGFRAAIHFCDERLELVLSYSTSARTDYTLTGASTTVSLYACQEPNGETGLDYFGARYFSSAQGRFTSPDPKFFPHDLTDPQSWNKYGYTRNNPLRYTDPDGEDWQDALKGAINAFTSDNAFGAGRISSGNSDFRTGQAIGDAVATVQGAVETLAGIGGEVGGTLLDLTGAGALIGVPAQVVSAGAIVHGSSTAVIAGEQLGSAAFAEISDQKQAAHNPGTRENKRRVDQGKPTSTFNDAKEGVELTHDTHATGNADPGRPDQKVKDYGRPIGKGARGGDQTQVRVHQDKKGRIHGHPDGPEQP